MSMFSSIKKAFKSDKDKEKEDIDKSESKKSKEEKSEKSKADASEKSEKSKGSTKDSDKSKKSKEEKSEKSKADASEKSEKTKGSTKDSETKSITDSKSDGKKMMVPSAVKTVGSGTFNATIKYIPVPVGSELKEKVGDLASGWKKTRIRGKKTPIELVQLDKLRRVWTGVFTDPIPTDFLIKSKKEEKDAKKKKKKLKNPFKALKKKKTDEGKADDAGEGSVTEDKSQVSEAGTDATTEGDAATEATEGAEGTATEGTEAEGTAEGTEAEGTEAEDDAEEEAEPDDYKTPNVKIVAYSEGAVSFQEEAIDIVSIIETFQKRKSKGDGVEFTGYKDDPENLYLNELKVWAGKLANLTYTDKDKISKRISYLDDILCKQGLFDRPGSDDKHTIQKVTMDIRRKLKEAVLKIDSYSAHLGARKVLGDVCVNIRKLVKHSLAFLWVAFRDKWSTEYEVEIVDKSVKLHRAVFNSPQLRALLPNLPKVTGVPTGRVLGFNEHGKLELHQELAGFMSLRGGVLVDVSSDDSLNKVFHGADSGFDSNFQRNSTIARLYLECYSFLLELGSVFVVVKQAQNTVSHSSGMLLDARVNANFLAVLELCDQLAQALRSRIVSIGEICETRFEQLVELNWATTYRFPWIENYREQPKLQAHIESDVGVLLRSTSSARAEATAVNTNEEVEDDEDDDFTPFVRAAEILTSTCGKPLHIVYNSYKSLEIVAKHNQSVSQVSQTLKSRDVSELTKEKAEVAKKQEEVLQNFLKVKASNTSSSQFMLSVTTSKLPGSGTDSGIWAIISGSNGKTNKTTLPDEDNQLFEAGKTDRFDVDVGGDLGEPISITLGLESGKDEWRVSDVELLDKNGGKRYNIKLDKDYASLGGLLHKKEVTLTLERFVS